MTSIHIIAVLCKFFSKSKVSSSLGAVFAVDHVIKLMSKITIWKAKMCSTVFESLSCIHKMEVAPRYALRLNK